MRALNIAKAMTRGMGYLQLWIVSLRYGLMAPNCWDAPCCIYIILYISYICARDEEAEQFWLKDVEFLGRSLFR